MRTLLFTSKEEDYLQDSIIHGFKQLMGNKAIDYPAKDMLYNDYNDFQNIRGNGFTLYGLLSSDLKSTNDIDVADQIKSNKFDLIIFTSIYRQYSFFYSHFEMLKKNNAVVWIMDGEDSPVLFPYLGKHLKQFSFSPKPHNSFVYFKRELLPETLDSIYLRLPVSSVYKFSLPKNIHTISFSIPNEKIIDYRPVKTKLFTRNIVDNEVAIKVYGSDNIALFDSEKDYYTDIQQSKFGITTKRAGWDCLRHYEIAANGAVICFKDLRAKPESCAPHGLIDGVNCISYSSYIDLTNQIDDLSDTDYDRLQSEGLKWAKRNTTITCINNLIEKYYQKLN